MASASTEELFEAAVRVIRGLPKNGSYQPSNQLMLRFYGFYKQATEGPCDQPKPSFWDLVGKAKWDAWKKLGDMSKEEAMTSYVEELKKIVETMAYTENVEKFMEVIGPFYHMVDFGDLAEEAKKQYDRHLTLKPIADDVNELESTDSYAAHSLVPNGNAYNNELYEKIEDNNAYNSQVAKIPRDNLMENYYSDSDSENDEFSDPIEIQVEEMKLFKKPKIDHNDNDSGFADQVENALRQTQNGHNHVVIDDQQDHLWVLTNGKYDEKSDDQSGDDDITSNELVIENNYIVDDRGQELITVKGMMARGGGDEDETTGGSSSTLRQNSAAQEGRGRSRRDSLNRQGRDSPSGTQPIAGLGNSGRSPGGGFLQRQPTDINEQIAMALLRLQRDMDSVLARLNVLETVALAQQNTAQQRLTAHYNAAAKSSRASKPFWWPFKDISFRTFLFFISWPIVLQILLSAWARRKLRKSLQKC